MNILFAWLLENHFNCRICIHTDYYTFSYMDDWLLRFFQIVNPTYKYLDLYTYMKTELGNKTESILWGLVTKKRDMSFFSDYNPPYAPELPKALLRAHNNVFIIVRKYKDYQRFRTYLVNKECRYFSKYCWFDVHIIVWIDAHGNHQYKWINPSHADQEFYEPIDLASITPEEALRSILDPRYIYDTISQGILPRHVRHNPFLNQMSDAIRDRIENLDNEQADQLRTILNNHMTLKLNSPYHLLL